MTLRELIQRAVSIARQSTPTIAVDVLEAAAEPLLPIVFSEVGVRAARDERLRVTLRRSKVLAVVNGGVTLPNDILTAYLNESSLLDPADRTKLYSYAPWDQLVTGSLDTRLGHYALEGESFTVQIVEPSAVYDPGNGPTGSYSLYAPCTPEVPAAITSQVVASAEVIDDLVAALASALKGANA